jgi:hypothetical protein
MPDQLATKEPNKVPYRYGRGYLLGIETWGTDEERERALERLVWYKTYNTY